MGGRSTDRLTFLNAKRERSDEHRRRWGCDRPRLGGTGKKKAAGTATIGRFVRWRWRWRWGTRTFTDGIRSVCRGPALFSLLGVTVRGIGAHEGQCACWAIGWTSAGAGEGRASPGCSCGNGEDSRQRCGHHIFMHHSQQEVSRGNDGTYSTPQSDTTNAETLVLQCASWCFIEGTLAPSA